MGTLCKSKMNLIIEYPTWFILFCIIAGLLYTIVLYRKDKRLSEFSVLTIRLMATLRFLTVTFLSFFLLSPLLKTINRTIEKPIIIVAQDNSESILANKDSTFYKKEYKAKLQKLINELENKYEVHFFSFADKIKSNFSPDSLTFNEKQTNLSSLFDEIETRYSNRNIGAVVLASDGLYNTGANPVYSADKLKMPIYTIALGDTTIKKDILLANVEHNRLVYLGNDFPLEITVNAKQLKDKKSVLTISTANATVFTQPIFFNTDAFSTTIPVLLPAKKTGLQRYTLKIAELPEEMSIVNNQRTIVIDVLDARQKILILADAPHPDIAAIKQSIEANQNYEVESYIFDEFNKPLKKYDLVILYQLPNIRNPALKIINELTTASIPIWCFSGANQLLKNNLSILSSVQKVSDCEPLIEPSFSLFTISDELKNLIKDLPNVACPYGMPAIDNVNALLYQRIGTVDTKIPMFYFNTISENKIATFVGEGIWRWRLQNFSMQGNTNLFDELISKTVQYLSVKKDKSFFRITGKNNFMENEAIELEAEVYNESYELVNATEVNIVIMDSNNKKFPYTFNKTSNAYHLNTGILPVGDYNYDARVKIGNKIYTQHGEFSVSPLQIELTNSVADHQVLYNIAKKHNAEMVYPDNMDQLVEKLINRNDIKSISYSDKRLNDLINLKWIFFVLLSFLSIEWFLRKRNGTY